MLKKLCLLALCCLAAAALPAQAREESPLHPVSEPFKSGHLKVSDLHEIYFECRGNPEGKPVMALHGGPGVGSYPRMAQYFDPSKFLVVLHDQRGCGRSTPFGELRENNTQNLVADIEQLRRHLDLGKVIVFGGSWGTTLGLAYAETHPEQVSGMLLRGVFLGTEAEIAFHYQGTGYFFPEEHNRLQAVLPDPSRGTHPDYFFPLIKGDDLELRHNILDALTRFEIKFMALEIPDEVIEGVMRSFTPEEHFKVVCIDLTYVTNRYFLEKDQIQKNLGRLEGIPVTLINGRYDMATPAFGAFKVHQGIPGSKLILVEAAGHSEREVGITEALVKEAARFE